MVHIFISYKRDVEPDDPVANEVFHQLRQEHSVFIDQTMLVGARWAEQIDLELKKADFLIVFLSHHSVRSEMVLAEVETAYHLSKQNNGRPTILPVRLNYPHPFQYPLSAYLNSINWAFWKGSSDTKRLCIELQRAIDGGKLESHIPEPPVHKTTVAGLNLAEPVASAQPPEHLEMPEGTMHLESKFYVERSIDHIVLKEIVRANGATITIKGPRQMGKSSLLTRLMDTARKAGKQVAFLDFQLFNRAAFENADSFFRQFATWLSDELDAEDRLDEHWKPHLGNSQRCTRYVERHLLSKIESSIVLAMDEVESVFDTPFRSDFFSMLRSWHNNRATKPIWQRLDLAFVTSTEPYQFIDNLNLSPFNVGLNVELDDFSPDQVTDLNLRHGETFRVGDERELFSLLNGQPYLTRRALYLVATKQISIRDLFANAIEDRGPFGDHLRYHLFRLRSKQELVHGYRQVISENSCSDEEIAFRLQSSGLARKRGREVMPRCRLYATYFRERLNV